MYNMILNTIAGGKIEKAVLQAIIARRAVVRGVVNSEMNAQRVQAPGPEAVIGDVSRVDILLCEAYDDKAIYHFSPNVHHGELEFGKAAFTAVV